MKIKEKIDNLPKSAGVYIFKNSSGDILYIGKAKNLKSRVSSYFSNSTDDRALAPRLQLETREIETKKTDSEVEATLLEAELIKKYKPPYNKRQKDDKSFLYVFINFSDPIPKIRFVRQKEINEDKIDIKAKDKLFGPYTKGKEIKSILRFIRKVLPYRDCSDTKYKKFKNRGRGCQWFMIKRCDGPCIDEISKKEYRQNISLLSRFLSGGLKKVRTGLKREMRLASQNKKFEKAAKMRDRIKALDHISEVSFRQGLKAKSCKLQAVRIEAVDISNISGKEASGSIVRAKVKIQKSKVEFDKNGYRRFKIRTKAEPDDTAMVKEVIRRRFKHKEWKFPEVLLIDGGKGQLNAAGSGLKGLKLNIPIISIAKGPTRKSEKLFFSKNFDQNLKDYFSQNKNVVKLIRDEAHRFAISYHRFLRKKRLLDN